MPQSTVPDKAQAKSKTKSSTSQHVTDLVSTVIRFAGDSGDGMQLTGTQFTSTAAALGNDVSTFPDFPSEIRAPAGSIPGVSGFQINFSSEDVLTPGDTPQALVAMNPAALKVHFRDLEKGGLLIVNEDAFTDINLKKAGYLTNPLEDGSLSSCRLIRVPITRLNQSALEDLPISKKEMDRSKNFFALGLMYWLYSRSLDSTLKWINEKFAKLASIADANRRALTAGYHYGETTEAFQTTYRVAQAKLPAGQYRQLTGNEGVALGLVAAAQLAERILFYGSYPITPASDILHELSRHKNFNVMTYQAEDEIAAIGAAIGASFAGSIGVTGTSGPGLALKSEALGLAVMTELPLIVINVQRAGPSTGMPTKTEQADLLQTMFGRNGESPVAIIAPGLPGETFHYTIEAVRLAIKYMCPVVILTDGYIANGAEPWKIPDINSLPRISVRSLANTTPFQPYHRDDKTLARPWVTPGTKGLEHRIGGLEKDSLTGNVSYDPLNHEKMVQLRAAKIEKMKQDLPATDIYGPAQGDVLLVGWGSTMGAISSAATRLRKAGHRVSNVHIRYLNPLPSDLGDILHRFKHILVPELNAGQLLMLLRAKYLVDAQGLNKVQGHPFKIGEVEQRVLQLLGHSKQESQHG